MKIDLGVIQTRNGEPLKAWLEPQRTHGKEGLSRNYDSCDLCVSGARARLDLTGNESLEHVEWKSRAGEPGYDRRIAVSFGFDAARMLMNEAKEYADRPFFAVIEHPQFGRLYASPELSGNGFFLESRPDPTSLAQSIHFEDREELQAFLTSGHLQAVASWMPSREALLSSMQKGRAESERLFDALVEYAPIQQAYDSYADDLSEYERLNMLAVRPVTSAFETDSPEFYRWYTYGGGVRPEPLTHELLAAEYAERFGADAPFDNPAPSAEQWEWLKNERLGPLRGPIETLQAIVKAHNPIADFPWLIDAARAADWVRTANKPQATEIFSAVEGLSFRNETLASMGADQPAWGSLIAEAKESILEAFPALDASASNKRLVQALQDLEFNVGQREAFVAAGDIEEVHFYDNEIQNALKEAPVFQGVFKLSKPTQELRADHSTTTMEP